MIAKSKKLNIFLLTLFAIFVVLFVNAIFFTSNKERNILDFNLEKANQYHGIIIKMYIDSSDRNTPTILLNNGKKVRTDYGIHAKSKVNDSISKIANNIAIKIYRRAENGKFRYVGKEYKNNVIRNHLK